ncbi:isotrichodermin c-15 hydroxylase [Diaporthe eres]|uniref:Isotrichodermin C-15 hydroxylase n=1 Tax=Diaporthe vaccinii TaxID=105482 RepID=A0ABR4F389_9PEZI|nr:isotrichodermin c-15 hydroxylase [Diaporthe eres]
MEHLTEIRAMVSLTSLPLYGLAAILLFAAGKLFYNLFLHPLRKYPGPFFAGSTRAYYLFYDVRGLSHWKVNEWHQKYGPVIRIAPDELSYTDSRAWPAIYGFPNKEGTGNFEKDAQWWNKTVSGVVNILDADDDGHRRMRRLQNPAFSDKALRAQESVICGYASLLVHKLHGLCSGGSSGDGSAVVDMTAWYNFTTFDIIGDLAFGEPFYCLQNAEWHWWLQAVFDIFKAGTMLRAARRFPEPLATLLCLFIPRKLIQTRKEQFAFGIERVDKRLQQTTDRPDFMSYILNADGEKGMTLEETYTAAQVLIVAGSETSATALCGATYLLLSNPATLARLAAEVCAAFASEADILPHSTAALPYLNAVVEEALRLCPPGPGTFPRRVPEGGRVVCGQFVPGGVSVGVHQVSTHRSPGNFREPLEFRPERWLGDPKFEGDNRACFHPFSFGPRNCIGKNLAYAETKTVLSRMVWNFDMKLHPDSIGWLDRQKTYTTWQKDEMKVEIKPRARA